MTIFTTTMGPVTVHMTFSAPASSFQLNVLPPTAMEPDSCTRPAPDVVIAGADGELVMAAVTVGQLSVKTFTVFTNTGLHWSFTVTLTLYCCWPLLDTSGMKEAMPLILSEYAGSAALEPGVAIQAGSAPVPCDFSMTLISESSTYAA